MGGVARVFHHPTNHSGIDFTPIHPPQSLKNGTLVRCVQAKRRLEHLFCALDQQPAWQGRR